MAFKAEKLTELLKHLAAEFMAKESSGAALLTITSASLSENKQRATIFFTVYPLAKEKALLDFAKRKRGEFRNFVSSHSRLGQLPFIDFALDEGEKRRQRFDEISREAE